MPEDDPEDTRRLTRRYQKIWIQEMPEDKSDDVRR
jgi:hypothetical protein